MKERRILQGTYDELSVRYAKTRREQEESDKCARYLLLHADVIMCTLSQAGSKCMLGTFKDNM